MDACLGSKINLKLHKFPLHQNIDSFVSALHMNWTERFQRQKKRNTRYHNSLKGPRVEEGEEVSQRLPPRFYRPKATERTIQTAEPYKELSDQGWFKRIFHIILDASDFVPESKLKVFLEIVNLVADLYPFVDDKREHE
jgi:hypothetical protein